MTSRVHFRVRCRHARVPAGRPAPPAPVPGRHDGGRARRGARGLGPDRPSRRGGPRRGRRPDLRGARAARRDPPRGRLPDAAHRHDARTRRRRCSCPGCPARPRSSASAPSSPAPASRSSPPCRRSCAAARRACSSASTWTLPAGSGPARRSPTSPTISECVWDGRKLEIDYDRGDNLVTRTAGSAGHRPQGGDLVPRRGPRRPAPDLSRVAGDGRRRPPGQGPPARGLRPRRPTGASPSRRTSARRPRLEVTVRVRRDAYRRMEEIFSAAVNASARELSDPEPETWRRVTLLLDWPREAIGKLLSMGTALEVLEPAVPADRSSATSRSPSPRATRSTGPRRRRSRSPGPPPDGQPPQATRGLAIGLGVGVVLAGAASGRPETSASWG